jgi:hypothetical protein
VCAVSMGRQAERGLDKSNGWPTLPPCVCEVRTWGRGATWEDPLQEPGEMPRARVFLGQSVRTQP